MPYEVFLALRYLRAPYGRRTARLLGRVAAGGIALGVCALTIALALANGFRDEVQAKILQGTAHITLTRIDGRPLADWRAIVARLERMAGVKGAYATAYVGALIDGPAATSYTILRALDIESERAIAELKPSIGEGSLQPLVENGGGHRVPIVIGAGVAERIGARVGDEVSLIVARGGASEVEPQVIEARIVGVFRSGLFEYDSIWSYAALEDPSVWPTPPSIISVEVEDPFAVARVKTRLERALGPGFSLTDWQEANRPFFTPLALEKRLVTALIALLVGVAALNVFAALSLTVVERRGDIAVLRTMGARTGEIVSIFLIQGGLIGALGTAIGIVAGLIACSLGNRFRLVRLPAEVYSLSFVPFDPHPRDLILTACIALLVSLGAAIGPARAAASVLPATVLRNE